MFTTVIEGYGGVPASQNQDAAVSQIFTSFNQVRPGLLWQFNRINDEIRYHSLWGNQRRAPQVPFDTALGEVNKDLIKVNWYRSTTEFFVDVLWADPPQIKEISNSERDMFVKAFEQASRWRSIKGYGVVRREGDKWYAVDTSHWHPVFNPLAINEVIGHILAYPWLSQPDPDRAGMVPDRLTVIEIQPLTTLRKVYKLDGSKIGAILSNETIASPDLLVFGNGVSDYTDIIDLVAELENRMTQSSQTLDKHGNPHMSGPSTAVDPTSGAFKVDPKGGYLPRDEDDPDYKYLTWDAQYQYNQNHVNRLLDMIYVATKLPATAFGLSDKSSQTGNARERQLFAALKKVQRLRRNIDVAVEPHGITMQWADQPFAGFMETVEAYERLVNAGILTAAEAKEAMYGQPTQSR